VRARTHVCVHVCPRTWSGILYRCNIERDAEELFGIHFTTHTHTHTHARRHTHTHTHVGKFDNRQPAQALCQSDGKGSRTPRK